MTQPCPDAATWIEVQLLDDDGNPVAGAKYCVELPDYSIRKGALDAQGKVRFDQIVPGEAKIQFPELDAREWKPLSGVSA
jgi:type VI secretion system secreted protein VgrG